MPGTEFIITLGGTGVAIWMLWMIASGRFHSDSEVQGLREDKRILFEANAAKDRALDEANSTLKDILEILKGEDDVQVVELLLEILARLPEEPPKGGGS